jgi:tetraacyldisaccharide 4'-kinase
MSALAYAAAPAAAILLRMEAPPSTRTPRRRPPWDTPLFAAAFAWAGVAYGAVMRLRRALYRRGVLAAASLPVPVVSVGNLVVGGVGKTPAVSALIELLEPLRGPILVVSRGYGAPITQDGETLNDEGWMLRRRHPRARFAQGAHRAAAARRALAAAPAGLVILDDGAQHLALRRDFDLFVADARTLAPPWRCLPAGPWREPPSTLAAADALLLTHCDRLNVEELARVHDRLRRLAPGVPVFMSRHRPAGVRALAAPELLPAESLRGRGVGLVSGIGNPDGFAHAAAACGAEIRWRLDFPDHHAYDAADLATIASLCAASPVDLVLVTEKDAVKLAGRLAGAAALVIALEISPDAEALRRLITERISRRA